MALFNETIGFSVQRQFFNANDLSRLGGCGTRPSAYAKTGSNILAVRQSILADSLAAQAPLAKIDIHSKAVCFVSAILFPRSLLQTKGIHYGKD